MIKLSILKKLCNKFCLQKQEALVVLMKATTCPKCKEKSLVEYNNGEVFDCLFCDYQTP